MAVKKHRMRLALGLLAAAYLATLAIVFTRPGAALSTDDRVVLRVTHWQIEAGPREAFDALIKRYEELNPRVRVVQNPVPGAVYNQWLRTQLIGGTASDIIEFGQHLQGMNDVPPRFFAPISAYVEEPNPYNRGTALEGVRWRDTFKDGLNTPDTYLANLGNYYAVTQCMLSIRLFYNPDLLHTITGRTEPPASYTELLALNEQLRQRNTGARESVALLAGSQFNSFILLSTLFRYTGFEVSMGMDRFRDQGPLALDAGLEFLRGRWDYRSPALRSGLAIMREVSFMMRPGFQQLERDAAMQDFLRGRALMIATGTWDATSLRTMASFAVGVTEFPWPTRRDGAEGSFMWSPLSEGGGSTAMALYVNKASPHQAEAVDFLRFITSVEGNTIFAHTSGWLPSIREVEVPAYMQTYLPRFDGFYARTSFSHGFGSETRDQWEREVYRLTSPQGSVEDFLAALEAGFPAALRRDMQTNQRNMTISLRRDVTPLMALAVLDRLSGLSAREREVLADRESNQTMIEAKLYESKVVLERGPEVGR